MINHCKIPIEKRFKLFFFTQLNNHYINKHHCPTKKSYFRTLKNPDWDSLSRLTKAVFYWTVTQTTSFVPNKTRRVVWDSTVIMLRRLTDSLKVENSSDVHWFSRINLTLFWCHLGGARYCVIFKDDYSGWTVIHFIQRKSEVEEKLKNYTARLRVEKGKAVNTLRTDREENMWGKASTTG